MRTFLVTGVSGAGKSAMARRLATWGHHAVSADSAQRLCAWTTLDGIRVTRPDQPDAAWLDARGRLLSGREQRQVLGAATTWAAPGSFGAEQVRMVEFLPLNGFESSETVVLLPDGLVLRRMSDAQISVAIDLLAAPRMSGGSVNGAHVSRFDQWALMTARAYRRPTATRSRPPGRRRFPPCTSQAACWSRRCASCAAAPS